MIPELVVGVVRDYDWGVIDGMRGWADATGGPQAELWFGAHPAAPSPLADRPGTLADAWPGYQVPLLAKILAAASPLSLQVHPDADLAQRWADDPGMQYLLADRSEKTEMLLAIEPFDALVGWRPADEAAELLAAVGAASPVVARLRAGDRDTAIRQLLGDAPVTAAGPTWQAAAAERGLDALSQRVLAAVSERFGTDPGVAVAALLAPTRLEAGEAAFVPAGVPHAYVQGLGFEIMNSSDNVLRMGLTSKTMSVDAALSALADDRTADILAQGRRYAPAGAPFEVLTCAAGDDPMDVDPGEYRLLVPLADSAAAVVDETHFAVPRGCALAIPPSAGLARVTTDGRAVVARATQGAS